MAAGEVIGILGESGCGKSTLALSILGLLAADAQIDGSILFQNEELQGMPEARLREIRGAKISLIHQEPGLALSPVMRVGDQISEVIGAHRRLSRKARKQVAEAILQEVHLAETERIYAAYPHQLSGGELHRLAIAQALACRPDLVIADEPTRSLDVTGAGGNSRPAAQPQAEVWYGTHLYYPQSRIAGWFCRSRGGYVRRRVVEQGSLSGVFGRPLHPYTRSLLDLMPRSLRRGDPAARTRLPVLPGGSARSEAPISGVVLSSPDARGEPRFARMNFPRNSCPPPVIG